MVGKQTRRTEPLNSQRHTQGSGSVTMTALLFCDEVSFVRQSSLMRILCLKLEPEVAASVASLPELTKTALDKPPSRSSRRVEARLSVASQVKFVPE